MYEELTIIAWMPALTNTKIQIGFAMYLIPAHMAIIAPAWWYVWSVELGFPLARMINVSRTS